MAEYAIYLRKSRADAEAEMRGEGETLARHRTALMALADRQGYHIAHIYQEIVSGDSIASRPQMQALLTAVQNNDYDGVIVNDIDRLGRGDSIDQAIIRNTFRDSNTLIITPVKVYDLQRDSDEDFADFSMFMARYEYKIIKRRMLTGRYRSASEGNWQGGKRPYGYKPERVYGEKGTRLVLDEHEAGIVRLIFQWYADGASKYAIVDRLAAMGEPASGGGAWTPGSLHAIMRNDIYTGDYTYGKRPMRKNKPVEHNGAFPAIIDRQLWEKVQERLTSRYTPPVQRKKGLVNPLAGLVVCTVCGKRMRVSPKYGYQYLVCQTPRCGNRSSRLDDVENAILDGLRDWVVNYTVEPQKPLKSYPTASEREMEVLKRQIETIQGQIGRLRDLVEQGAYSVQEYIQRKGELDARLDTLKNRVEELREVPTFTDAIVQLKPIVANILDVYRNCDATIEEKNQLLKSALVKVEYTRPKEGGRGVPVELVLYPKLIP